MAKRRKPSDRERVQHIIEAIEKIEMFLDEISLEEFKNDEKTQLAITKLYEIIGEAAYNLSKDYRVKHADIPWEDMAGMRHVLVHNYYEVIPQILWETWQDELPELKDQLLIL